MNARKQRRRLAYQRGYSAGRRNRALSMTGQQNNAAFCRGWGAGQTWLHVKIGAWEADDEGHCPSRNQGPGD